MQTSTPIIDAHHHLWDLSLHKHPWLIDEIEENHLGNYAALCKSYLISDFLHDCENFTVKKSVHIQAGWDRDDPLGESRWLEQISLQHSHPQAIVFYTDLSAADAEHILTEHTAMQGTRGVRQILSWHNNPYYRGCSKDYIQMDVWQRNFALLKKHQLSFDMQIYPEQVDEVLPIITRHDEIAVVIDHALMPIQRDAEYLSHWRKQLKKLSALPQVCIKISGLAMFDHAWGPTSFKEIILPVVDTFSPARCMIGSNFPVDKLYGSFDEIMSAYMNTLACYSKQEQADIFHHTAERFYRI